MRSVSAIFLKFRGTNDKGWLWFRFCSCGAVGVVFVLFCESVLLMCSVLLKAWYCILLFERLKRILFIDVEKTPKKSMRATLACLLICVCIAHLL